MGKSSSSNAPDFNSPPKRNRIDRANLKTVVTYVEPEVARQIKVAAAESGKSMQDIGEDALILWLEKYNERRAKQRDLRAMTEELLSKVAAKEPNSPLVKQMKEMFAEMDEESNGSAQLFGNLPLAASRKE